MKVAYCRVSTLDQNDSRQKEALEKHGIDRWFVEKASAKDTKRPQLQEMLEFVRQGDTIYVHDFSRLARSTQDLLAITEEMENKGVYLVSNKESIDSSTPSGKLMLTMIGAIYEFERSNMLERQREGIAIAKQRGAYKGRKKIKAPDNWDSVMTRYYRRDLNATEAMKELGLKRNSFYRLLTEHKAARAAQAL